MKRRTLLVFGLLCIMGFFGIIISGIGNLIKKDNKVATATDATTENQDYSSYYTYDQVEEMVLYLSDSEEVSKNLSRLIDPLSKSEPITVKYILNVVSTLNLSNQVYAQVLYGMEEGDYVTKEQFDEVYNNIADSGLIRGLYRQDFHVFSVQDNVTEDGTVYRTVSDGNKSYILAVELPEEYQDKIIDIYVKNGEIFKINGYGQTSVEFPNVWLLSVEDGCCNFLYNGKEKSYMISGVSTATDGVASIEGGRVAKIVFDNTGVISVSAYEDILEVQVINVENNEFQMKDAGLISYSKDIKIYDISGTPFCEYSLPALKAHTKVKLIRDDGVIIAAIIEDKMISQDIRVIISNNSYSSYTMPEVTLTCDTSYKVEYPDDAESVRTAGKTTTINYENYDDGDVITVKPTGSSGKIQLLSIDRECGNPIYEGIIEIRIQEDGLHIINELSLEKYLYSVVASEMPSSNPPEALKAMAVCARGYAYSKIKDRSFDEYHAHLDDSTICQVYNNVAATESTVKAVKDTYGIVPLYEDTVILPLYFSTSSGVTCSNAEIWGGESYPYLTSNVENEKKDNIDLSEEEAFRSFINDSDGYDIIDKDMPYYRWSIEFTRDEISEAVNSMLEERIAMSADNIKTMDEDGDFYVEEIYDIGQVKSIKVQERSVSGVVTVLEIEGSEATIQITGQTNIRNIITPINQNIIRQDGVTVTGWTSLPSPFYYIECDDDTFTIYGGGFGHGVGMSQNGAKVLAEKGHNYKYILKHYYSDIDFSSIYVIDGEKEEE